MLSLTQLIVASALLALSTAVPVKHGFSVSEVAVRRNTPKNGPAQLVKAYAKYNVEVPTHVLVAAKAISTGSVVNNAVEGDAEFICPVKIGGQTLNLNFDTGSADLWVFSTLTPSSQSIGHNKYNPATSTTAVKLAGSTWKITYGDGSGASGVVYNDTVNIGGTTVTSQAVEPATSVSAQFTQDTMSDGLVGLAFSSINTIQPNQQATFFSNAAAGLPSPIFTANLRHNSAGTYNFGYIDSTAYTGSITYAPISNARGFWMFTASGYIVGTDASNARSAFSAVADTGTSLLLLDNSTTLTNYYKQMKTATYSQNQGGYIFSCSEAPPNFTVVVNGYQATVPGRYINYAPNGDGTCYGGIQSTGGGIGFSIFGAVFIKSQFLVFDHTLRLGFANKPLP